MVIFGQFNLFAQIRRTVNNDFLNYWERGLLLWKKNGQIKFRIMRKKI